MRPVLRVSPSCAQRTRFSLARALLMCSYYLLNFYIKIQFIKCCTARVGATGYGDSHNSRTGGPFACGCSGLPPHNSDAHGSVRSACRTSPKKSLPYTPRFRTGRYHKDKKARCRLFSKTACNAPSRVITKAFHLIAAGQTVAARIRTALQNTCRLVNKNGSCVPHNVRSIRMMCPRRASSSATSLGMRLSNRRSLTGALSLRA